MGLKLSSEDEEVTLPKELALIREVMDDDAYKNVSLTKDEITEDICAEMFD